MVNEVLQKLAVQFPLLKKLDLKAIKVSENEFTETFDVTYVNSKTSESSIYTVKNDKTHHSITI